MGSLRAALQPHPDTPSLRIEGIEVQVEWSAGRLWLRFHVDAPLDEIAIPDPAVAARSDGLWRSTCFELFARIKGDGAYLEFNLSPSSQWAAYRFEGYRIGSEGIELAAAPEIGLDASEGHLALEAVFCLPDPWDAASIEIGLSAVLEEIDGTKSYWALAHPPGKPDFHHPDCFALKLGAASAS